MSSGWGWGLVLVAMSDCEIIDYRELINCRNEEYQIPAIDCYERKLDEIW
jgi:hypothetical protein